jgi:DNA repair protein RadC
MKEIPWFNRPWTKLKRKGAHTLDDAELLSMIMMRGNKENNCLELSNRLLEKHNLHEFGFCGLKELKSLLGEEVKAFQILAIAELCKRYSKLKNKGFKTVIETSSDVYNHFKEDLKNKKKEYFYAILLDVRQAVICKELISVGTINQSFAHPREVFRKAIQEAASSIILVHNHPSGDKKASKEDLKITKKLVKAGELLGIKVLDHVIIGEDGYWSYTESEDKGMDCGL